MLQETIQTHLPTNDSVDVVGALRVDRRLTEDPLWKDAIVVPLEGETTADINESMAGKLHLYGVFSDIAKKRSPSSNQSRYSSVTFSEPEDQSVTRRNLIDAMMRLYDGATNDNNTQSLHSIRLRLVSEYDPSTVEKAELLLNQHNDAIAVSIKNSVKPAPTAFVHRERSDKSLEIRPATKAEHARLQSVRTAKTVGTIIAREGITYGFGLLVLPAIHYSPLGELVRDHPLTSAVASNVLFYATLARFMAPSIIESIEKSGESLDGIATNINELTRKYTRNKDAIKAATYTQAMITQLVADVPSHSVLLTNFLSKEYFPILHDAGNEYFLAISLVGAAVNYGQYFLTRQRLNKQSNSTNDNESPLERSMSSYNKALSALLERLKS